MRSRRRESEDETPSETEAPERVIRPWSRYAQSVTVVVRETIEAEDESVASAVSLSFLEVDLDLPLEEFVPEINAWLAERRGDFFQVAIGRSYSNAERRSSARNFWSRSSVLPVAESRRGQSTTRCSRS